MFLPFDLMSSIAFGIAITTMILTGICATSYAFQVERSGGAGMYSTKKIHTEKRFIILVISAGATFIFGTVGFVLSLITG